MTCTDDDGDDVGIDVPAAAVEKEGMPVMDMKIRWRWGSLTLPGWCVHPQSDSLLVTSPRHVFLLHALL